MEVVKDTRNILILPKTGRRKCLIRLKRNGMIILWTLIFGYYYTTTTSGSVLQDEADVVGGNERHHYYNLSDIHENRSNQMRNFAWNQTKENIIPTGNCTPPGIEDFPGDLFTQQERRAGWVVIHFLVSLYLFVGVAVVCDDYFVPCMECICEELSLPNDVAGATFMAIATSAPELFTNIIGTFITKGDVGVGTIVGSAVFNILVVAGVCGIGAGLVVPLVWWSITRDCVCYLITVILLLCVLQDERIYWYEALVLVLLYFAYILVMYHNTYLKDRAENIASKTSQCISRDKVGTSLSLASIVQSSNDLSNETGDHVENVGGAQPEEEAACKTPSGLCFPPNGEGIKTWLEFILCWPYRLLYTITIPDCKRDDWSKWYPITFFMCIVWTGTLSYLINWMMTVIGHTCHIPDSMMGLTFIAAGSSVPEVVSCLIVARQGHGTMAVSNSIGSNIFDVLMCLGLPWLIRSSLLATDKVENYVQIHSQGFEYSTIMLIVSLAIFYGVLACNGFKLDRKVGGLSLLIYGLFLVFASLMELNVFFIVNQPTCRHDTDDIVNSIKVNFDI